MFPSTEEGPINHELVKAFVQERLSYFLPEYFWKEINLAFAQKWNEHLRYGGWFYWDEITDFVYERIVSLRIHMIYEQVQDIVDHMLNHIERSGGFLDDDRC